MLQNEDVNIILNAVKKNYENVSEKDIAFLVLCDTFADKNKAFKLAYGYNNDNVSIFCSTQRMMALANALHPFGVGSIDTEDISSEQNKAGLLALLKKIELATKEGALETKDALNMEKDVRVKLQDKFDMEDSEEVRRIIIVPQKHDIVCPHTHHECTYMPTKEACIKHYNLKEI